jgi:hypothetical protein
MAVESMVDKSPKEEEFNGKMLLPDGSAQHAKND